MQVYKDWLKSLEFTMQDSSIYKEFTTMQVYKDWLKSLEFSSPQRVRIRERVRALCARARTICLASSLSHGIVKNHI